MLELAWSAATREVWVIPSPSILILLSEIGVVCRPIGTHNEIRILEFVARFNIHEETNPIVGSIYL